MLIIFYHNLLFNEIDDLMRLERISDQEVQPLHVIPAEEDSVLKQSSDLENKIFPYIRPKIYELHYLGSGEVRLLINIYCFLGLLNFSKVLTKLQFFLFIFLG